MLWYFGIGILVTTIANIFFVLKDDPSMQLSPIKIGALVLFWPVYLASLIVCIFIEWKRN